MAIDDLAAFEKQLRNLVTQISSTITVDEVRRSMSECKSMMVEEAMRFDLDVASPYFSALLSDPLAIFYFFEDVFSVYVFSAKERPLITELDGLALEEVDACRTMLVNRHGKREPDLVLPRSLAEAWLDAVG